MNALILAALPLLTACQKDVVTEFPDGLEPLEDTLLVDAPEGYAEEVNVASGEGDDYAWAHARGYLSAELDQAVDCMRQGEIMVDRRSVDEWTITDLDDPQYDFSVEIWNLVYDLVDVEFTNQWRQSVVEDAEYGEVLAVRWQKTEGSDFLPLLEGSMLFLPVDEGVLEVQIIEHLDALIDPEETAAQTIEDYYTELRAHVKGEDLPSYTD